MWRSLWIAAAISIAPAQEFPSVVTIETGRAEFHNAPLRSSGDTATQVRQAMDHLREAVRGGELVKLRVFLKDGSEAATVRATIARRAGKTKPALTLVEVGDLPRAGARVAVEAISTSTQVMNPAGLLFVSGQPASATVEKPVPMPELARQALEKLRVALAAGGAAPGDVLRATAYLSSSKELAAVRTLVDQFLGPGAPPVTFAQLHRRGGGRPIIEIEAIARLRTAASGAAKVEYLNPEGLPHSPNYTQAIAVRNRRLAVSGGFACVADTAEAAEKQAHETFGRLAKALESSGAAIQQVVFAQLFPVSDESGNLIRKVRVQYYDASKPPASTMLGFQGAGVARGLFVVEVTAPLPD